MTTENNDTRKPQEEFDILNYKTKKRRKKQREIGATTKKERWLYRSSPKGLSKGREGWVENQSS